MCLNNKINQSSATHTTAWLSSTPSQGEVQAFPLWIGMACSNSRSSFHQCSHFISGQTNGQTSAQRLTFLFTFSFISSETKLLCKLVYSKGTALSRDFVLMERTPNYRKVLLFTEIEVSFFSSQSLWQTRARWTVPQFRCSKGLNFSYFFGKGFH